MIDSIDCCNWILLQNKYLTNSDKYNENESRHILEMCIKANKDCFTVMSDIQEIILKSIFIKDKTQDQFAMLQELKSLFDEHLNDLTRLSESLEMAVTPKNKM